MSTYQRKTSNLLTFGLASIGGIGICLAVVALGMGVLKPAGTDTSSVGWMLALGLLMMFSAIVAWTMITRPFDHFDDINKPLYHGHAHTDDHALVVAEAHDVVVADAQDADAHGNS